MVTRQDIHTNLIVCHTPRIVSLCKRSGGQQVKAQLLQLPHMMVILCLCCPLRYVAHSFSFYLFPRPQGNLDCRIGIQVCWRTPSTILQSTSRVYRNGGLCLLLGAGYQCRVPVRTQVWLQQGNARVAPCATLHWYPVSIHALMWLCHCT